MSHTDEQMATFADEAVVAVDVNAPGHFVARAAAILRDKSRGIYREPPSLATLVDLVRAAIERRDQAPIMAAAARVARLEDLARWLVSMDAMRTEAGWTLRQTVSLNDIIERAREALGEEG